MVAADEALVVEVMHRSAGIVRAYERELVAAPGLDGDRAPVAGAAYDEVRDRLVAGALTGRLVDRP